MELKIDIARIYIDENKFCCIDLDTTKKDNLDRELAEELCETVGKVCQMQGSKILTDSTKAYGFVSTEARRVIRHHPDMLAVRKAEAFVINSLANRLIVKVYLKFDQPPNPVKVFNNREEAVLWLNSIDIKS